MLSVTSDRFHSITSSASLAVQYHRLPNTDLLAGYTSGNFTRSVAYESARPLITSVENKYASTIISRYDYENDVLGRRTAISRSGTAFGNTPVRDAYGYNVRSEVTSARRSLASNPSQEVRGFSYDYEYDPIGNRVSSTEYDRENNPRVSSYTANALNQYEERTIPSYAAVRGSATNTATVTVNGNPTWRLDDYFYCGDKAERSAPRAPSLEVLNEYGRDQCETSVRYDVSARHVPNCRSGSVVCAQHLRRNLGRDAVLPYIWDDQDPHHRAGPTPTQRDGVHAL